MDGSFGGFGVLSAPKVKISSREEERKRRNDVTRILEKVKALNTSAKRTRERRINSLISFQKGSEEKRILILKSDNNGFSVNMNWSGDVLIWTEDGKNGEISYYLVERENYESVKKQKEKNVHARGTLVHGWNISSEEFECYFKKEEN